MGNCFKKPKETYTTFVEDLINENEINYPKYVPPTFIIDEYDIYNSSYQPPTSIVGL